jgi:hypothetical protein
MSVDESSRRVTEIVTSDALRAMLGIEKAVPLSPEAMAQSLRVTFFPGGKMTPRLTGFAERLRDASAMSRSSPMSAPSLMVDAVRFAKGSLSSRPVNWKQGTFPSIMCRIFVATRSSVSWKDPARPKR